jgi:hypothetical protein
MRVSSIDLYSNDQQVVQFDVNGPDVRNPYILKGITGLDAESIVPRFYSQGAETGNNFYDMALEPREIGMKIGINPNYNLGHEPSDLRGDLYRAIASSRKGTMQLRFNDGPACVGAIEGFVTNFTGPLNNKEVEVTINLRCDDPIFKSLYLASTIVTDLDETNPLLIDPISTSPHGFKFKLTFSGSVNPFTIQDPDDDWFFTVNYAFLSGDELYFSSESGDKYLYRVRSAVTLQLMDLIEPGSVWPIIFPGENLFEIVGTSFVWNEVYWYDTHWGV